jgi:dTDP-4-dehydrorhamnose 3,5-epimerase-like enzyme
MQKKKVKPDIYVLNEKKAEILVIPPNHYNGFVALEDCFIICLSSLTLEDSLKDDIRVNAFAYGKDIWEVKYR